MTNPQYTLFLNSIEYRGDNIGSSLRFVIKVGDASVKFQRSIKRGSQKKLGTKRVFKIPKQITTSSLPLNTDPIKIPLTIEVIEKEKIIINNDKGTSTINHEFEIIPGHRYIRIQRVDVGDTEGDQREVASFYFELVFQINDFNVIVPDPKGPPISPPVIKVRTLGDKAVLFWGNCDIKCLIDCHKSSYYLEQCSEGERTDLKCLPRYNPKFANCIEKCCKHQL